MRNVDVFYSEVISPYRDDSKKFKFSLGTSIATPGIAGLICLILFNVVAIIKDKFKKKEILVNKMTEDENEEVKHLGE